MKSITVYPTSEKQKALLKSLLEEMKIQYETKKSDKLEVKKNLENNNGTPSNRPKGTLGF